MKPVPTFDWSEMEAEREARGAPKPRPAGSVTVSEYAAHFSLSQGMAREELNRMAKSGKMVKTLCAVGIGGTAYCYTPVKRK